MKCSEFEVLIMDYLEGTLDEPTAGLVEQHLQECGHCRVYYQDMKALLAGLLEVPEVEPSEALDSAWLASLEAAGPGELLGCEKVQELVALYAREELSPEVAELVEAHLAECAECRAFAAHQRELHEVLAAVPEVAPTSNVRAALEAEWSKEQSPGLLARLSQGLVWQPKLAYATAAAALIVVFAFALSGGLLHSPASVAVQPAVTPSVEIAALPPAEVEVAPVERPKPVAVTPAKPLEPEHKHVVAPLESTPKVVEREAKTAATRPGMKLDNRAAVTQPAPKSRPETPPKAEETPAIQVAYAVSTGSANDVLAQSVRSQRGEYDGGLTLVASAAEPSLTPPATTPGVAKAASKLASAAATAATKSAPATVADQPASAPTTVAEAPEATSTETGASEKPLATKALYEGSIPATALPF